eukprot:TRINITY_DN4511_c0_g1_i5.p1 TRINITY_DN4511_c0_g1~~TRINITY_DN4511_c0_g1_i5.p1  ORF type:complete len:805 (+),score=122.36 TRINITY_DN4511_c0_g1_i5:278-2692(+)
MEAINRLKNFIVTPCMEEEETYAVRSRKLVVIAFAVIVGNALTLGIPASIVGAVYDPTFGVYFCGAALVQVLFTASFVPYIYLRLTNKLPDWVVDLQVWSCVPTTLGFCLFSHQGSISIVCTTTIFVGIVMRVRMWPLLLLYGVCINVIHALINDYGDELPALHETFYHTQILPVKLMYLLAVNISPLLLFGLGLWAIMKEFVQRSEQADAAIAMNLAVAAKLRRYDTDGIAEILAANKGKVDENLLEAFTAIQHNLQEYRPHIPDYVIAATIVEVSDDYDDGVAESGYMRQPDESVVLPAAADDEGDLSFKMSELNYSTSRSKSIFGYSATSGGIAAQNQSTRNGGHGHVGSISSHPRGHSTPVLSNSVTECNVSFVDLGASGVRSLSPGAAGSVTTGVDVGTEKLTNTISAIQNHSNMFRSGSPVGTVASKSFPSLAGGALSGGGGIDVSNLRRKRSIQDSRNQSITSTKDNASSSFAHEDMSASKVSSSKRSSTNENGRAVKVGGKHSGAAAKGYTGQATTVFIRFIAGACGSLQGCDGTVPSGVHTSTVVEYLGLGVEAAAKHAKLHGGAMQYMQGCGLMVSFNAASRVNAHESKACAFALGLKAETDALPKSTLTMHATIVTTPVMSFFAGNGGQLMLTVLGGYMPIHTALHHYLSQTVGDDVSCILISKTTLPSVEVHYEARMLGVVGMSPSQHAGRIERVFSVAADVIQLVSPRKATESDEWMYELENQTSTHGFTKMIVDTAASGDLQAAMRIVTEHEAAIHNDTLLSRCLHDRIESCIEDSTAFPLHTTPPTKMW